MKNFKKGFIIPLIIAVVALLMIVSGVYLYINKKQTTSPVSNIDTNNVISTSTKESGIDYKSELSQFDKPAVGKYKLVNDNGEEQLLNTDDLLQNGNFFKNKLTGAIYYIAEDAGLDGGDSMKLKLMPSLDNDNFYVYKISGSYATDLKNVYVDAWIADTGPSVYILSILKGADYKTFNFVVGAGFGKSYEKDAKTVFYNNEPLSGVDANSFKISVGFTSDKNHVYLDNKIIPEADPLSYQLLYQYWHSEGMSSGPLQLNYGKDNNYVFADYCKLSGVDANSFVVDVKGGLLMDKKGGFTVENYQVSTTGPDTCTVVRK